MGKRAYIKELIERAADIGADCVKFQLFPDNLEYTKTGNVYLSDDLFLEAMNLGKTNKIDVTASAFDQYAVDLLIKHNVPFIKFAYGKSDLSPTIRGLSELGKSIVISRDLMNVNPYFNENREKKYNNINILYCISQYPVLYQVDWFPITSGFFDGISDHTMGIGQTLKALEYEQVRFVEKHVTLEYSDIKCPDRQFAINFTQAKELCDFASRK